MENEKDYIDIQVVGTGGCGKTTFIKRTKEEFNCEDGRIIVGYETEALGYSENDENISPTHWYSIQLNTKVTKNTAGHIILLDATDPNCLNKLLFDTLPNLDYRGFVIICINKVDDNKSYRFYQNGISKVIRENFIIPRYEISSITGLRIGLPIWRMIEELHDKKRKYTKNIFRDILTNEYIKEMNLERELVTNSISNNFIDDREILGC